MKIRQAPSGLLLLVSLMLAMALVAPSFGQERPTRKTEEKAEEPQKKADAETRDELSTITAVVGARIMTVTRGVIRDGTILIRDGKILAVAQGLTVPEKAVVIDAKGKIVTPGFICLNASPYGISGSGTSEIMIKDALNPYDHDMEFLLGTGITTICSEGRGSSSPSPTPFKNTPQIVLKMSYGKLDGMFVKENPFFMVSSSLFQGGLNSFNWRDTLEKAKGHLKYLKEEEAKEAVPSTPTPAGRRPPTAPSQGRSAQPTPAKKPKPSPVGEDILKLLRGEVALRVDAGSVNQIRQAIAFAKEYDYQLILEGVEEGWLMADELGQAVEYAIISPRTIPEPEIGREEITGGSIELSKFLENAGIPFAIKPRGGSVAFRGGMVGDSITGLPIEAMFAVSGGCSAQSALESITIVPARMMGLADRLGSIEPGKDADILILDGHPLDYKTYVETAIVNGNVVYEREENRVFPVFDRSLYNKADDDVDPSLLIK